MSSRLVHDVHRHLWPEPLLDALRRRTAPPCLRDWTLVLRDGEYPIHPDGYGPERCLAELDRDGIDVALVSCPPTLGVEELPAAEAAPLLEAYHEGVVDAAAASGGRLLALAMHEPRSGFAGLSVSATVFDDLDRLAPSFAELEREGAVLFVHPGPAAPHPGAPGWWTAGVDYTAQMQAAYAAWLAEGVDRWPELRVVFAILAGGAPMQLERLRSRGFDVRRALHPTLYLDTASYGRRAFELCLATYGGRQLVFGSDAPVISPKRTLEAVRSFGQAVMDAVCVDNPNELLSCLRRTPGSPSGSHRTGTSTGPSSPSSPR
jgi:predicted TIM-barrel fold metal-dependent hydrolase